MRSKTLPLLLLIALLALPSCTQRPALTLPDPPPASSTLTVLAASSLTESFTELGALFETQNPGVKVVFGFAGSQQIAQQLGQGAAADVFASASQKYMDAVVDSGRVSPDAPRVFVQNRLVVILPKDNPAGLTRLQDLARPGLIIDLADKTVPVGQYSLDFLDKAVQNPAFDLQYRENVLKNVVSYEDTVKAVVTKVSLGEADAGIVYLTDVTGLAAQSIASIEIPDDLNSIASYPIAPVADSKNPGLASAFVDLVLSPEGQAVLARYGFIPIVK